MLRKDLLVLCGGLVGAVKWEGLRVPACTHGPLSARSLMIECTLVEGFIKRHYCYDNAMCMKL